MSKNWVSIIETARDELREAIKETYQQSVCGNVDLEYRVSINREGKVESYYQFPGTIPADEWHGKAICVFKSQGWRPEIDYKGYFTAGGLLEDRASEIVNKHNEINNESATDIKELSEIDIIEVVQNHLTEIMDEIEENERDYATEDFDPDIPIDQTIREIKNHQEMVGE